MNNKPIGILDSGMGGLSIWQEVVNHLPHESTVYIGDSAHAPYGTRTEGEIYDLSKRLVTFLLHNHAKVIIVACNTITVTCLDKLRAKFPEVPIVGTVPVIKTAASVSRTKHIGILSTTRTANSAYQKRLIEAFANDCSVVNQGTDALVPIIEAAADDERIKAVIMNLLPEFQKQKVDALALGCTHFPLIKQQIQEVCGPEIMLLDSSAAIARQVSRVLANNNALVKEGKPTYSFYTTGKHETMELIAKKYLGVTITARRVSV